MKEPDMDDRINSIVLVGGGLAAATAAQTLRERGFAGQLTLVGDEPHLPYERPPLSKQVLAGTEPVETTHVRAASFYTDHGIELLTGDAVTEVDRAAGKLTTDSGRTLPFDRLLLATGASPRRLPLGEGDLDGILTLRTIDDAQRLHDELRAAEHVTIVGAGWIGCEVAAAARGQDTAVTLVDPLDAPLQRVVGPDVGAVFAGLHHDHGVDLRLGVGVSGARGGARVEQVTLTDGTTVDTGLVVVGIGVVPRTRLAERAGLRVDDGIVVDATLATEDPRIFAAGDVARAFHPGYGRDLRVEHWANALNQGRTAAANLLGDREAYDRLPYFFSDQYDLGLEYVGHADEDAEVVFRGDPGTREFVAFWVARDRVVAAMNVNVWDVVDDLKRVIAAGSAVDLAGLADPAVALADLAPPRD
jgi:3-phenylpropionate/trans-cinnamate dioxygenase ferredoxin reductase subunit